MAWPPAASAELVLLLAPALHALASRALTEEYWSFPPREVEASCGEPFAHGAALVWEKRAEAWEQGRPWALVEAEWEQEE